MIVASEFLKELIRSQNGGIDGFSKLIGVSRPTIYKILEGESVSSEVMGTILQKTGIELPKAFEVKGE